MQFKQELHIVEKKQKHNNKQKLSSDRQKNVSPSEAKKSPHDTKQKPNVCTSRDLWVQI